MQRRAQNRAAELGISLAEYVRSLLAQDLGQNQHPIGVSAVFDLVSEGHRTTIARDKDTMVAEAAWYAQCRRHQSKAPRRRPQIKASR
jgi:hypothetical protein